MRVFRAIAEITLDAPATVASIGNFDGVHCAHQHVLREVVRRAREIGGRSLAITFDPHPPRVLRPDKAPKLITAMDDKLTLMEREGIDATLVIPFDEEFAKTTSEEFCRFLCERANVREIHEGANFRFGRGAAGDVSVMQKLGCDFGFSVIVYPEERIRGEVVSSSRIRALVAAGELNMARHLLGREFSIKSTPAHGRGYGARYTVPTINLAPYAELVPAIGVYVTELEIDSRVWRSVTNVGNRPTFGEDSFAIETHILDFEPMSLGEDTPLRLSFLHRLRDERKFESADVLKAQILRDVEHARRWFALRDLLVRG
jgi:riboflavin kinase / FMN adenylyltransferase